MGSPLEEVAAFAGTTATASFEGEAGIATEVMALEEARIAAGEVGEVAA